MFPSLHRRISFREQYRLLSHNIVHVILLNIVIENPLFYIDL